MWDCIGLNATHARTYVLYGHEYIYNVTQSPASLGEVTQRTHLHSACSPPAPALITLPCTPVAHLHSLTSLPARSPVAPPLIVCDQERVARSRQQEGADAGVGTHQVLRQGSGPWLASHHTHSASRFFNGGRSSHVKQATYDGSHTGQPLRASIFSDLPQHTSYNCDSFKSLSSIPFIFVMSWPCTKQSLSWAAFGVGIVHRDTGSEP